MPHGDHKERETYITISFLFFLPKSHCYLLWQFNKNNRIAANELWKRVLLKNRLNEAARSYKKKEARLLTALSLKALGEKVNLKVKLFESMRVTQEKVWVLCKVIIPLLWVHKYPYSTTVFSLWLIKFHCVYGIFSLSVHQPILLYTLNIC